MEQKKKNSIQIIWNKKKLMRPMNELVNKKPHKDIRIEVEKIYKLRNVGSDIIYLGMTKKVNSMVGYPLVPGKSYQISNKSNVAVYMIKDDMKQSKCIIREKLNGTKSSSKK